MTLKQSLYNLLREAYSLASGGIGVQRHFLDTLIQGRDLQRFEDMHQRGIGSIFLDNPLVQDTLYPRIGADYMEFFGDRGKSLRQKARSLDRQEKEITNIVLRSIVDGDFINNPKNLSMEEYITFVSVFQKAYVDENSPKKAVSFDKIADELMGCNNLASLVRLFHREQVYPSEQFYFDFVMYKISPGLRKRHIKYNADKLELMVNILEYVLEIATQQGYKISLNYKPRSSRHNVAQLWKEQLGETLPTVHRLINNSRKSIQSARGLLSLHV